MNHRTWLTAALMALLFAMPARAADDGLLTRPSTHDTRTTLDRFAAAVRESGWVVFTEIDHAAAAKAIGATLRARTVILFGNPRTGSPAMAAHPSLALDLPMRALVWEDEQGHVFITRSTAADIASRVFARHGVDIPPEAQQTMETMLDNLARKAAE